MTPAELYAKISTLNPETKFRDDGWYPMYRNDIFRKALRCRVMAYIEAASLPDDMSIGMKRRKRLDNAWRHYIRYLSFMYGEPDEGWHFGFNC